MSLHPILPEFSSPASAACPSIGEVGAAQPQTDKTILGLGNGI